MKPSPLTKLIFGVACISLAPILVQWLQDGRLGHSLIAFYRTAFGTVILALMCLPVWMKRGGIRPERPPQKGIIAYMALAGLFYGMDFFCWHRSIKWAGPGMATILGNTQVFYVAFFGCLFMGERLTRRFLVAVPLAFTGVLLLALFKDGAADQAHYYQGVACGLVVGPVYGASIVFLHKAQNRKGALTTREILFLFLLFTAMTSGLFSRLEGGFVLPSGMEWLYMGLLALVVGVLGWLLISDNMVHVPVSIAGLALLIQPVLSSAISFGLGLETWTSLQFLGGALTICAIYLGTTRNAIEEAEPRTQE